MTDVIEAPAAAGTTATEAMPAIVEQPMFVPGGRGGPGRPKGLQNQTTIALRTAIVAVFRDLQAGHDGDGEYPHFLDWARRHPTEYYRLALRQLPVQVDASGAVGLVVFKGLNDGR